MTYLAPSKRAIRASSSLLRFTSIASVNCRNARLLHESSKSSAVHAVTQPSMDRPLGPEFFSGPKPSPKPVPRGQLNILDHVHNPEFYQAIAKIMKIRADYVKNRFTWIPSAKMIDIVLGLGAKKEDLAKLAKVGDSLTLDPTLPFRKSVNGRICFDYDTNSVRRLEFQPFALSVEEDFNRYDSGVFRRFNELENNLQLNTVMQAMLVFKSMVVHGVEISHRPKLEYNHNKHIGTLFCVRTTTNEETLGEPALEGIHTDGVDHTMTTLMAHKNMRADSAATFMHAMHEDTGIPLNSSKPENIRARVQHIDLLDTLIIVDNENKHSLSPVYQEDTTKDASRDMIILFTRKPVEKEHISGKIDSQRPHKEMPMEIPLFVPKSL